MMIMKVIPAIDIMSGRCVQLVGGRPETKVEYGDPAEIAVKWSSMGAQLLHVVDLDAALGTGSNLAEVKRIKAAAGLPINFGGGVRTAEYAAKILDSSVDRVILGTMLVDDMKDDFPIVRRLSKEYGRERLIASVDSRGGFIAVKGWTEKTKLRPGDVMKKVDKLVWGFLYTNVDVEGLMKGVNIDEIKKVVGSTKNPVIASGGITTKKDVEDVKAAGAWGVVLGKALYEGKLNLRELIE